MELQKPSHFSLKKKRPSNTDMDDSKVPFKVAPKKRKSSLGKVSASSLFSPMKPMRRVTKAIQNTLTQRSLSLRSLRRQSSGSSLLNMTPPPRSAPPTVGYSPAAEARKPRQSPALWSESLGVGLAPSLNKKELIRQETIHELCCGEQDFVADLSLLFNECIDVDLPEGLPTCAAEVALYELMGMLRRLLRLHIGLCDDFVKLPLVNGAYQCPADILQAWFGRAMVAYCAFCSQLVRVQLFISAGSLGSHLSRLESSWCQLPGSQKRSFVNMLDAPRNRLVKYPLLLSSILKRTTCQKEASTLSLATGEAERILKHVNHQMGLAKSQFIQKHIVYPPGMEFKMPEDTQLLCDGQLKTSRGTKMQCFLFREALLLTRQVTSHKRRSRAQFAGALRFELEHPPICSVILDASPSSDECSFQIRSGMDSHLTLRARDRHDRQLWLSQIRAANDDKPAAE